MTEETSDQVTGRSTGSNSQFPDSQSLTTESGDYVLNLTDRESDTAKIHIDSLTECNGDNPEQIIETLGTLTMDPDCPVDEIGFTRRYDSLITLQIDQESTHPEDQHRDQIVADYLISEL
jgi:hypothetical protein